MAYSSVTPETPRVVLCGGPWEGQLIPFHNPPERICAPIHLGGGTYFPIPEGFGITRTYEGYIKYVYHPHIIHP